MESLALLVAIIVAPAMFGGPIALLLSFWRRESISTFRRLAIFLLSCASTLIGLYLLFGRISIGATLIGLMGIATGVVASWRVISKNH
ncbi:MAG: phosphatase [Actinobacteria bacterium]|nr:phosphatase [Actinomycetota bacterium]